MAKHWKRKPIRKEVIIGSAVTAGVAVLAVLAVVLVQCGAIDALAGLFSSPASSLSESASLPPVEASSEPEPEPEPEPVVFQRPDALSGVRLSAGTDYLTSASDTAETVKKQLDTAFADMEAWGFNTILLPVTADGKTLYPSTLLDTRLPKQAEGSEAFDPLAYVLETAKGKGMFVYGVFDFRVDEKDGWDPTDPGDATSILAVATEAARRYAFDGWLLEGYAYPLKAQGNQEAFAAAGEGRTMAAFMEERLTSLVKDTAAVFRAANRNAYVGLLAGPVWAHKSVDPRGSDTASLYEDYTDGRADTLGWLDAKLFDFVLVRNDRPLGHASSSFEAVLRWWSAVCGERSLPYYVLLASDKAADGTNGFSGDQMARQYQACQQAAGWGGSVFSSLSALKKDTGGFAGALHQVLEGTISTEYTFKTLTFSNLKSTSVTTNESKFTFMGSTDPHFPVTMNGKKLTLTEKGAFAEEVTLQPGTNKFTFVSNGKTVTYTIVYTVTLIKSVSPTAAATLEGGSIVSFSAIGRKDAALTAAFNGKTLTMKASPLKDEEGGSDPEYTDYQQFTAAFTLPEGKRGQAQPLGSATVSASYKGLKESKKTGTVTVKAAPNYSGPEVTLPGVIKDLKPINPNTGGTLLDGGDIVMVTKDYVETFDGNTVEDWSRPTNAYLPKGTTDVVKKTVQLGSAKYYLLGCGRRVYAKDVDVYVENGKITANTIQKQSVEIAKSHTILRLDSTWRIPYNLQLLPQSYRKPSTPVSEQPNYSINSYGQTTEYIDITFAYTTSVPSAPDMSNSPLFRKAEWRKSGNTAVLRLTLREKGQFYGYSAVWDNDGVLQLSFKHPSGIAKNPASKPLQGVRIVLDPGHGGNSSGTYGTIPKLYEKTLTLRYAKTLKNKLEALGATVAMTRTTDVNPDNPDMSSRTAFARNNGTDLLISVHMNGVKGQSASGCSIHYFNEYSYPINRQITDAMQAVEKTYGVGNRWEACAWSPFFLCRVHDCPSILIEYGFMTNPKNMELLNSAAYEDKLVQGTVNGILAYFRSLPTYHIVVTPPTSTPAPPTSSATSAAGSTTSPAGSTVPAGTTQASATATTASAAVTKEGGETGEGA